VRNLFLKQVTNRVKCLIFSTQLHRVLISWPLSPSQKQWDLSEQRIKERSCVRNSRISWRKITVTSIKEVTAVCGATNLPNERKNRYSEYYVKNFVCRPKIGLKHFDKLSPNLARLKSLLQLNVLQFQRGDVFVLPKQVFVISCSRVVQKFYHGVSSTVICLCFVGSDFDSRTVVWCERFLCCMLPFRSSYTSPSYTAARVSRW